MDWEKFGLFISLITPLFLGVGAWVVSAVSKKKPPEPEVVQGLPVDYETDYIKLLKSNLAESRKEVMELKKEIKYLRSTSGNPNNHPEE